MAIYDEFSYGFSVPWPFCDRCVRRRWRMILLAVASAVLGVSAFVVGMWTGTAEVALRIAGLALLAGGGVGWYYASWKAIAGAKLSDHSAYVEVKGTHDAFVAQVEAAKREAARQATWSGQVSADTEPRRLLGALSPLWYLLLLVGIGLTVMGILALGSPQCGTREMLPGDLCETTEHGRSTVSSYEEERVWAQRKMIGGGVGILLIVVSGIRIQLWNSALRRAYAAASGNAVT